MPRLPRLHLPDGIFHVTARGNRRQTIFLDRRDAGQFLNVLASTVPRSQWRCHSYCLMPNHYHLLVESQRAALSDGMRRLNGAYAQWFNRRHGVDGHLFQGRFHAAPVLGTWHLLESLRYIALNPVASGLCDRPAAWRWSSYGALVGTRPALPFLWVDGLLPLFGEDVEAARTSFASFVEDE